MNRRRLVRVPASSANLGPGFDVLAAALQLHLELEVVETGRFAVHTDLKIRTDRRNLLVRAFETLHPADEFEFTIRSKIPLSGGLGSSASAVVAGLMAADHIFELDTDLLAAATEIEGHPDNAAAALHGGVVIAGSGMITRFEPPPALEALLVVPAKPVRTAEARAVLPTNVPRADASANVAAAAQLVYWLLSGDFEAIAAGLHDRLHQPYRAHLYPQSAAIVEQATQLGALGATISGAGPTVLVWTQLEHTGSVAQALSKRTAGWANVMRAPFEPEGAYVREL